VLDLQGTRPPRPVEARVIGDRPTGEGVIADHFELVVDRPDHPYGGRTLSRARRPATAQDSGAHRASDRRSARAEGGSIRAVRARRALSGMTRQEDARGPRRRNGFARPPWPRFARRSARSRTSRGEPAASNDARLAASSVSVSPDLRASPHNMLDRVGLFGSFIPRVPQRPGPLAMTHGAPESGRALARRNPAVFDRGTPQNPWPHPLRSIP
jgi:hypothetical protein